MQMTFVSAVILLLLVMDPLGGVPLFMIALKNIEESRRRSVILRECAIAFIALLVFMLIGKQLMELIQVSPTSLGIAGGIILFLIAIRIIFPTREGVFGDLPEGEPLIVPLAIPILAGPSAFATVVLLVSREPARMMEWILALVVSVLVSAVILVLGVPVMRYLGTRGLMAFERLIGLLLTAIAVEMFLDGVRDFINAL